MAKVLREARIGLGSTELILILMNHQWLGPSKPRACLCGEWTPEWGETNKLEGHAKHVTNVILEGV